MELVIRTPDGVEEIRAYIENSVHASIKAGLGYPSTKPLAIVFGGDDVDEGLTFEDIGAEDGANFAVCDSDSALNHLQKGYLTALHSRNPFHRAQACTALGNMPEGKLMMVVPQLEIMLSDKATGRESPSWGAGEGFDGRVCDLARHALAKLPKRGLGSEVERKMQRVKQSSVWYT